MNPELYSDDIQNLINNILRERVRLDDNFLKYSKELLIIAKELKDPSLLSFAYYYAAEAYYMQSDLYDKFSYLLLSGIQFQQHAHEYELLSRSYNLLGIDALNHGNDELGLDYFLTAIHFCAKLPDDKLSGIMNYNIGQIYCKLNDYKSALKYTDAGTKTLSMYPDDPMYQRNMLYCHSMLGICYIQLGKTEESQKEKEIIYSLLEKWGNPDYLENELPLIEFELRYYNSIGNTQSVEENISKFIYTTEQSPPIMDYAEDLITICHFLLDIGYHDMVRHTIEGTKNTLLNCSVLYIKIIFIQLMVRYYGIINDTENEKDYALLYYKYSIQKQIENQNNYKFYMEVRHKMELIQKENDRLSAQAVTDPLTGIGNRYALNEYGDTAFEKAYICKTTLGFEILDIDNFKEFNDTYGHQEGDLLLRKLAGALKSICNDRVHCFRYGGDEFVIIYENYSDDEVNRIADDLRTKINNMKIPNKKAPSKFVTISQGIRNSVPKEGNKLWDYMYVADIALYEGKKATKGEIVLLHKTTVASSSLDDAQRN
jgi:diguanylate cyclase (GGDEF)-like protein